MPSSDAIESRKRVISSTKRLVIKVGSRLLADNGSAAQGDRIRELVERIASLRDRGIEVVLVSSGAIAAGMALLELDKRPGDLSRLQALAAAGQSRLMSLYEQACKAHGFHCGQLLLCADDVTDRQRHLNVCNCIYSLLSNGVLPVVNENDSVSVDEIRFGDNDKLAAMVASMIRADLTIFLTTVDGLHDRTDTGAGRVSIVHSINKDVRALAGDTDDAATSTGGMASKIEAASIVMGSGEPLWIADGRDFGVLDRIFAGDDVGTLFMPAAGRLTGSKRYLAFFTQPVGTLVVDAGAADALRAQGRSLLPSGLRSVVGDFFKGDTVDIIDADGASIGLGMPNYSADDMRLIVGKRSSEIHEILGHDAYDEAVHRDNLVILNG